MAAMASFAISMLPRGEELMGSEQWLGYESLFASVDVLHCALLLILLVGILLASFTEDASRDSLRVSWIATQLLPGPRSQPDLGAGSLTDVQQMMNELAEQKAAQRLKKILQPFVEAVEEGRLVALLCEKLGRLRETVAFYCRVLHVRRFAEGTRHLFYMAQKIKLGMDVKPGESEVLTYVDSKMALKEDNRWPFMVEVADVKSDRVTCAGRKKAYPMSSYSYLDFIREPQVTIRLWLSLCLRISLHAQCLLHLRAYLSVGWSFGVHWWTAAIRFKRQQSQRHGSGRRVPTALGCWEATLQSCSLSRRQSRTSTAVRARYCAPLAFWRR